MGYISTIYAKLLEKKLRAKAKTVAENRVKTENQLRGEVKFAEKRKRLSNSFLEVLIENGASETRCVPYANRAAELEQEISVAKTNLENFGKDGYLATMYAVPQLSSELMEKFTEDGKEIYLRVKARVDSKYSQRGAASAATA